MEEILFRYRRKGSPERMINRLKKNGIRFSVRHGSECTEIVVDDSLFTFTSDANFPVQKLFLFSHVKRDVKKWLSGKTTIEMPNEFPVTEFNPNFDDNCTICGIDLNHAYWRLAYLKGIINEKTYNYGLEEPTKETKGNIKALRLATLSILGREKSFEIWENGTLVEKEITQPLDPLQQMVFKYIRLMCYDLMNNVAKKLGKDFDCWKTDCIYFKDTPENRKIVCDYFDRKNMPYKILDYFPPDETDNKE